MEITLFVVVVVLLVAGVCVGREVGEKSSSFAD